MILDKNKIQQIDIRSEYFEDILDKVPSKIVSYGSLGVLFIFILACLGMNAVKYPDVITSDVIVTTERPPIEVHCKTSGRISHLLKHDQENVNAGEWIVILNNSANYNDILKLMSLLNKIDATQFWNSILRNEELDLTNLGDLQEPYYQFAQSVKELRLFKSLDYQGVQFKIDAKRESDLLNLENELKSQLNISMRQAEIAKSDFDRNAGLEKDSVIAKTDLEQKEISYLNAKNKLEDIRTNIITYQLQIDMLKKDSSTLTKDESNAFFNIRRNVIQNYYKLTYSLSEWKSRYVLQAPITGLLSLFEIRTTDQFLSSEQKVFIVSPNKASNYFAIAKLPVANSGKVQLGQGCIIKLTDYPFSEFGILKGEVKSISAASKEGYYSVRIDLPNQLSTNLHKQLYPKSELSGEADIVTADLTLFDRLFKSLLNKNY